MTETDAHWSEVMSRRRAETARDAEKAGLLDGKRAAIGVRVPETLLEEAKARAGVTSTTAVVEYALSRVAIEDDFSAWFRSFNGAIPDLEDIDL